MTGDGDAATDWTAFSRLDLDGSLSQGWTEGLQGNPAAPVDVQVAMLGLSATIHWRLGLPDAVVEAALRSPHLGLRTSLTDMPLDRITTEQWSRLLLDEPEVGARWKLLFGLVESDVPLTDEAFGELAAGQVRVRRLVAAHRGLPATVAADLAADPDAEVRDAVCHSSWRSLDERTRHLLVADPDEEVREEALMQHHRDHP